MFKPLESDKLGYQLFDLGNKYALKGPKGIYQGSLRQVCAYAVQELGFSIEEIELGVLEMERHFHNAAEYGVFKGFMFTFDKEEKIWDENGQALKKISI